MQNKNGPHLFLVSTPLHLLVSLAIIAKENLHECHLFFIDQVKDKDNPYIETLNEWPNNPFKSISLFYRSSKSLLEKLATRKRIFIELKEKIQNLRPEHIYVGNDRRIEFQWCMHCCQSLGKPAKGYYMDEGTFTYVGRKASGSFSDKVVDNYSKKLAYGFWWKHPPTVGASDWVQTVYASYPEVIHPLLKQKQVEQLTLAYWQAPLLTEFCRTLIDHIEPGLELKGIDAVFTLPHESIMESNSDYQHTIYQRIQLLVEKGLHTGVKYHPRDTNEDALGIKNLDGVTLLPSAAPFETMLTMFKPKAVVIGDFSTTLITTRLLRPDIAAVAIDHGSTSNREEFMRLYQLLGIEIN